MYKKRVATCGERISEALHLKGVKQYELCKLANVPKSSLSLYLSGAYEPKQDRVYIMAKALNVSEAWLMGYDVSMERQTNKIVPEESNLTEDEIILIEAFRKLPEDVRKIHLETIRAYADSLKKD